MRIQSRIIVNLIAVLVIGIVSVGWVITQLVGTGVGKEPFTVTADFAASGGVFTNQEVTYRGVLIGKVGDMTLNDDGVDVQLLIEPEWAGQIPTNSTANIQSKSAVGEQFVNLTPAHPGGPFFEHGDRIDRSLTRLPVDFQELLTSLDRVLGDIPPDETRELIEGFSDGLAGKGDDIAAILRSLATLSEGFAEVAPEQQRLLDNATTAADSFLDTKDEFADAIRAADEVFAGIGDEPEELRAMFEANDRFARKASRLLNQRGSDLHAGIRALGDFVDLQWRNRGEIDKTLRHLPGFLHAVEDASIPWRDPTGEEFYRIRVGIVFDNVPSTWPCPYVVPFEYQRLPHLRDARSVARSMNCDETKMPATSLAATRALIREFRAWLRTHPLPLQPMMTPIDVVREKFFNWPQRPEVDDPPAVVPQPEATSDPVASPEPEPGATP